MQKVGNYISTSVKSAADSFLGKDEIENLKKLVDSLEKLYIFRALNVNPEVGDEDAAKRLVQIVIPLESQLYHSTAKNEEDLIRGFSLIASIFEYAAKIEPDQSKRNELWLRASLAYLHGKKSANSIVTIGKYEQTTTPDSSDLNSELTTLIISFLSRDVKKSLDQATSLIVKTNEELKPDKVDSIELQFNLQGQLELASSLRDALLFLKDGEQSYFKSWKRHMEISINHFQRSQNDYFVWLTSRLEKSIKSLLDNSLWNLTSLIPEQIIKAFTQNEEKPIFDLWDSQVIALKNIISKGSKRHHSLIMPTSSGKTLVATIIAAKQLLEKPGNCFYITPYRALVSEVSQFMNRYLPDLGLKIKHLPGEYDAITELENIIAKDARIFILTPEKLDLLWRQTDQRIKNSCIFIFDEVQNVIGEGRGLRLELLISKIKKTYGYFSRIILLSAVIPENKAVQLVEWLGTKNSEKSFIEWAPTREFRGIFYRLRKEDYKGNLVYVDKFHINSILPPDPKATRRQETMELVLKYQKHLGPVLVYCNSKDEAQRMAELIFQNLPQKKSDKDLDKAAACVKSYTSSDSILPLMLKSGIAYHHASLSNTVKSTIEKLGRDGKLDVICCTSTLAEGVNLNVGTVIISSVYQGGISMEGMRLQNLAGRAGRALKDTEGHVILMDSGFNQIFTDEEFIRFQSRFYQYMLSILNDTTYLEDVEVIESDLLARFYKNEISQDNINESSEDLLKSTLFYNQANVDEYRMALSQLTNDMKRIVNIPNLKGIQLKVFAETGLGLKHCQQLDDKAKQIEPTSLKFRQQGSLNWLQIQEIISFCMLEKPRFSERILKNIENKMEIIRNWVLGKPIIEISKQQGFLDTKSLNDLTNFLYGYVADELPWVNAAFIKLIDSNYSDNSYESQVDYEYHLLPSYLKYGVNNPGGLLLCMAGLEDRDLANHLSQSSPLLKDNNDWINIISWVLGQEGKELEKVHQNIIANISMFSIPLDEFVGETGKCEVNDLGQIYQNNKIVSTMRDNHLPLIKILKRRKCATISITRASKSLLQITPA